MNWIWLVAAIPSMNFQDIVHFRDAAQCVTELPEIRDLYSDLQYNHVF